jgi:hypothetical protein
MRLHVRRFRPVACALVVLLLAGVAPLAAQKARRSAQPTGYDAISGTAVYDYVKQMASPQFTGRLTATEGYTAFAKWAAGLFKQWGLAPLSPAAGYLMPFPTEVTTVQAAEMGVTPAGGSRTALRLGDDFLPLFYSDSGKKSGEVVFAGWCISAPELGYDDYANVSVKGKWAMCFRGTPDPADERFLDHDEHRTRMKTALDKGALGVIYIYEEPISNPNGDLLKDFLPGIISYKAADSILKEKGLKAAALREDLVKYRRPLSFELKTRLDFSVTSQHVADGTGYNVVGVIPGSDPLLKQEYIVVGGHADHTGTLGTLMFPGANDNASGTAAAMEIGRAVASLPVKPKRTLVIALFGGEEMGLKGSEYFASHLPAQLGKCVGMVNFDMVGEGDGLYGSYSPEPAPTKRALEEANKVAKVLLTSEANDGKGRQGSDHASFMTRGIPIISFSSNGPHLAYHQVGDTIYRLNPEVLGDAARLGYLAAVNLARD